MSSISYQELEEKLIWTQQEDTLLATQINFYGTRKWKKIQQKVKEKYSVFDKTTKQCRDRWYNCLNPDLQKIRWSDEEINCIFQGHKLYGTRWSMIGKMLSGRSDNAIKNLFYCRMRKMIRRVAKQAVSEELYFSLQEFRHSLYLLDNLRRFYIVPLHSIASIPGDQYIVRIIGKYAVNVGAYVKFVKKLMESVPDVFKCLAKKEYSELLEGTSDSSLSIGLNQGETLPPFSSIKLIGKRVERVDKYSKSLFCFDSYIQVNKTQRGVN